LEVIVFDELIQIDTEHFKSDANVRPKSKVVPDSHNVLAVFMVLISQRLQDFYFNLSLLMELLPVLQNLDGYMLFGFMVKASQHDTKRTPSELLLDFVAVLKLILGLVEVVRLIIVKAMVVWWPTVLLGALILTCELVGDVLPNTLVFGIQVEVVYHFIIGDFIPLVLR
jgi:hypothetical protein